MTEYIYTYEDIIIDPTKEGIGSLIGKEVYFHDSPSRCLWHANEKAASNLGVLVKIDKDYLSPFVIEKDGYTDEFACIIEKKEEPKPKPKYVPFENITEFLDAYRNAPGCLNEEACYLSKNGLWLKDNEIDAYCMVTEIWDMGIVIGNKTITIGETTIFNDITSWDELLEDCTFLDGSPCGKEVK